MNHFYTIEISKCFQNIDITISCVHMIQEMTKIGSRTTGFAEQSCCRQ